MQQLAGLIKESQLNEEGELKVTFLKQKEADKINQKDMPGDEYEEDIAFASSWATDQRLFDKTYSSLEDLAQTIVDVDGGNMRDTLTQLKRMIEKGIISKSQVNENSFGPDSNFQWQPTPAHPEDMVKDEEEGDIMTKEEFWRDNVTGLGDGSHPDYGTKQSDGTWLFTWGAGEFSGFVEGDDFTI